MATTWTQGDIDALKPAIAASVLTVTYAAGAGMPSRTVTYQSLGAMRALLAEMVRQVSGAPTFRRVSFSKGFDPPGGGSDDGSF